jgi:UDP-N-acetyl-D-glucosamine dehydrogenase
MNLSKIIKKIEDRNSIIGIIGLGYVGLPLLIRFSEEGFNSIGFDVDRQKIEMLNNGKSYIKHISSTKIKKNKSNNFHATSNFSEINKVDIIIICVPTPLGMHNEPDLTYIKKTIDSIKIFLKAGQVLILESTTYPGTTVEEIVPEIKSTDSFECIIGKNFFVGYSPEREDPGNKDFSTKSIPKVVSGISKNCLKVVSLIYSKIVDKTVPVSSTQVAEMTKIFENIHRAVNIGLVNELKVVADKMSIDIYEVINAAKTKPFGFTPYYPGPGLGGHCIPIDPYYLTWKAKEVGMNTRFIELAGEINRDMPKYVVDKIGEALNTINKSIKNSKVFILGLSYKKNVDDLRESPSLEIIDKLNDLGAKISFNDPILSI